MKTTRRLLRAILPLPFVLASSLLSARGQGLDLTPEHQAPWDPALVQENLAGLLRPNDSGKLGSGEKDSLFRLERGRVVLRGDLKVVPNFNYDARGKGNDDLSMHPGQGNDLSENIVPFTSDMDAKDAAKDQDFGIDCIAGLALDVNLGKTFEAISLEYKKNLLDKDTKPESQLKGIRKFLANEDFTLKIAGFTIRCPDAANGPSLKDKDAYETGSVLKNGIKAQFWAGFVPIVVRANAGLCFSFNVGPVIDPTRQAYALEVEPALYVHGWLGVGVGIDAGPLGGFCVGIAGKLRLLDSVGGLEGGICLDRDSPSPFYAAARVTIQGVKVEVQLFALLQIGWASRTFTWTLYTFKFGKFEKQWGLTPRDVGYFPVIAPVDPVQPGDPSPTQPREPKTPRSTSAVSEPVEGGAQ